MAKKTNYIAKIPDEQGLINYSAEEHAVWRDLYTQQNPSTKKYAADVYLKGLDLLDMPDHRIPQWPLLYHVGGKNFSRCVIYSI